MKTHGWKLGLLVTATIALPFLTGCGGSGAAPTASNSTEPASAETTAPTASENAPKINPATVVADGMNTPAAQCVAVFLDSLRRGDEQAANGVLTPKAQEELAKTSYAIQPLGTPEGKYTIGRVGYPYPEKTVALVECTWTEPAAPGEEIAALEIVCEVHQETVGWRISGMGVTMEGSDEALVLDFEDAASIEATIGEATGQAAQPAQQMAQGQLPASQLPNGQYQQQVPGQQPGVQFQVGTPQQSTAGQFPAPGQYPQGGQGLPYPNQGVAPAGQYQAGQYPAQQLPQGQYPQQGQVQQASGSALPSYPAQQPPQQGLPAEQIAYPPSGQPVLR